MVYGLVVKDMQNVVDSLQMESGTKVGTLVTDKHCISIEVRGEVKIDYKGEWYKNPNDFPKELKDLIASGKLYDEQDVYVDMSNWFEILIYDKDWNWITSDVVDCEKRTPMELFGLMLEYDEGEYNE